MYLKVECPLELRQLAPLLAPDATPESFAHDSVNGDERLFVSLPDLPFALNLAREHSSANPSSVYISGWDRAAEREVETLPDWLAQHIADELLVTVLVYSGSVNRDVPDPRPIDSVRPHLLA